MVNIYIYCLNNTNDGDNATYMDEGGNLGFLKFDNIASTTIPCSLLEGGYIYQTPSTLHVGSKDCSEKLPVECKWESTVNGDALELKVPHYIEHASPDQSTGDLKGKYLLYKYVFESTYPHKFQKVTVCKKCVYNTDGNHVVCEENGCEEEEVNHGTTELPLSIPRFSRIGVEEVCNGVDDLVNDNTIIEKTEISGSSECGCVYKMRGVCSLGDNVDVKYWHGFSYVFTADSYGVLQLGYVESRVYRSIHDVIKSNKLLISKTVVDSYDPKHLKSSYYTIPGRDFIKKSSNGTYDNVSILVVTGNVDVIGNVFEKYLSSADGLSTSDGVKSIKPMFPGWFTVEDTVPSEMRISGVNVDITTAMVSKSKNQSIPKPPRLMVIEIVDDNEPFTPLSENLNNYYTAFNASRLDKNKLIVVTIKCDGEYMIFSTAITGCDNSVKCASRDVLIDKVNEYLHLRYTEMPYIPLVYTSSSLSLVNRLIFPGTLTYVDANTMTFKPVLDSNDKRDLKQYITDDVKTNKSKILPRQVPKIPLSPTIIGENSTAMHNLVLMCKYKCNLLETLYKEGKLVNQTN